ncbi:hypothetical protein CkaCkLH20_09561 [Colletotrichum karsti]|uniref:Xylanolytic transcriptional activator regulatory domain-containing protein n=1 Tax=Colletotrichum karsti TaxID=1095194 RepID=A0A9P6I313_9PEZI|nr:uncharacterized protein CkaCkLH20_09561 [Colletotrichum karsti]KAF9873051.1 hypothetical protein CkaCkLH20_09561 [Colletotrichum karsti]
MTPKISTPADDESETGSMRISASDHQYVGGEHWAAILDSIADLRDHFDREEQFTETPDASAETVVNGDGDLGNQKHRFGRALLLYGCKHASSRNEILSALPPKSTVDRYISRYFNQLDLVASSSVHGPTFLREYESFWENPSGPPIMWIGLLFSMICLALIASESTESPNMTYTEQQCLQIELYREKVVQCLMMGEYTHGGRHSLETFMNYVYIEFRIHDDAEKDVWFLHGIEVNLAKHGEMRRRMWATILLGDSLISGQMGMPLMITSDQFDTVEPRNLNDSDIDGETSSLPPSRPETENTTSLGLIARRRVLIALGVVADLTSSLKHSEYTDYMKADLVLNEAGQSIPPPLKMHSMASSVTDTPQTIMSRLFLRHIFTRGQIMLHRKFLFMKSPSTEEDSFAYSRTTCTNAALETLHIQQILDEETSPGGQLQAMQWRVGSLMNHHFLTATMILCAMVHQKHTLGREEEIMRALRTGRAIWMRRSQGSREAQRAAQAVSIVLAKAGGPRFDIEIDLRGDSRFKCSTSTHELSMAGDGDRPSEVPQGSGISTSPQKKLPAMGHAEAMDLAASVISEEQVASLRASLTDGNLANLTETSRPLFDQYLSNTAEILARGPSSDGNPFITYVLPLALGDSLIMDCVLGIGGAHMAALDSKKRDLEVLTRGHYARVLAGLQKVLANEAESYFGNTKQEKEQYVLLILLLLCVFEHTQGDIHGSVYHHIKASRHYILSLMKAPRKTASMDKLGHIRGFLLEIYSFMALKLSITPRGAMEDNPITLDPFLGSLDFLKEYKSCGFMLGFGHGLFGLVPEIADLVEKRRLEELNNSITSATFEAYKSLVAKLDTWDTFSDVLEGKDSSPRFQQGPAVSIYRTALILYLHSAFHENLHECAELCDEIDLLIDRVLPLLWGVYSNDLNLLRASESD